MEEKVNITICLGSSCFAHGNSVNMKFIKDYLRDNNLTDKVNFKGELCNKLCNEGPVVVIDNVTYKGINKMQLERVLDKTFKHQ